MAKPFEDWIGNSCHIHSSLFSGRRGGVRGRRHALRPLARRVRSPARSELARLLRADDQLVQALRGGELGADDARLGPRQPHVWLPRRRARQGPAGRDADPRRRRQPVPRLCGADRVRAPRDRAGARGAAAARGQRLRVGRRSVPVDDARGDRRARGRDDGARARSATRSSTTTSTTRVPSRRSSTGSSPTGSGRATSSAAEGTA